MQIEVIGVYPIEAPEPCHLVELMIRDGEGELDMCGITQEFEGQPQNNWQVPWDEAWLDSDGETLVNEEESDKQPSEANLRVAFFFHYLDLSRPFRTPAGPVSIPQPTEAPARLRFMRYQSPC